MKKDIFKKIIRILIVVIMTMKIFECDFEQFFEMSIDFLTHFLDVCSELESFIVYMNFFGKISVELKNIKRRKILSIKFKISALGSLKGNIKIIWKKKRKQTNCAKVDHKKSRKTKS